MDFGDILTGVAIVLICTIAIFTQLNFYNASYGTTAGSTFNGTLVAVQQLTESNLSDIGIQVANNTIPTSGAAGTNTQDSLITKSLSTFGKIRSLMGIVPDLIGSAGTVAAIPQVYVNVGKWLFLALFGLTLGYILLLGTKRLFGL